MKQIGVKLSDEFVNSLPFRIRFCQSKGRYGEATRDIEPTELILRDKVPWLHFWSFKKKIGNTFDFSIEPMNLCALV